MAVTTAEQTRALALEFAQRPDQSALATNAIFAFAERDDRTGRETVGREVVGREAVAQALASFYHGADAVHTPAIATAITAAQSMIEIAFLGRDLGQFFGLPSAPEPTIVPCVMVLTIADDQIMTGYLTFDLDLLRHRVGTEHAGV